MNPVEIKDLPGLVGQEVGVSDWVLIDQDLAGIAFGTGHFLPISLGQPLIGWQRSVCRCTAGGSGG